MNPYLSQRPEDEDDNPFAPAPLDAMPVPALGREVNQTLGNTGGGGAPPAPMPGIAVMQPPEKTIRSEWHGPQTSTKRAVASPETQAHIADAEAAGAEQIEAKDAEDDVARQQAEQEALVAEKKEHWSKYYERERELKEIARQRRAEAAAAREEEALKQSEKDAKITDYWEDRGTPAKIFAAILIGLNAFARSGRGMGGGNTAWEIFKHAEANDRQLKLDRAAASKGRYERAKGAREAVDTFAANDMKRISDTEEIKMKTFANQLDTIAKSNKNPLLQAQAEGYRAKMQEDLADRGIKRRQHYEAEISQRDAYGSGGTTTNISSTSGKAPKTTEAQGRAEGFMITALNEFGKTAKNPLSEKGANTIVEDDAREEMLESAPLGIGKAGRAGAQAVGAYSTLEQKLDDKDRAAARSAYNLAEVFLRDSTGANAPDKEVRREAARIARRPGDTPKDIEDKRNYAVSRLRGIAQKTGDAEKYIGMIDGVLERAGLGREGETRRAPSAGAPRESPARKPAARPGSREAAKWASQAALWLRSSEAKRDPETAKTIRQRIKEMEMADSTGRQQRIKEMADSRGRR